LSALFVSASPLVGRSASLLAIFRTSSINLSPEKVLYINPIDSAFFALIFSPSIIIPAARCRPTSRGMK
jgi:hypothetical protein